MDSSDFLTWGYMRYLQYIISIVSALPAVDGGQQQCNATFIQVLYLSTKLRAPACT